MFLFSVTLFLVVVAVAPESRSITNLSRPRIRNDSQQVSNTTFLVIPWALYSAHPIQTYDPASKQVREVAPIPNASYFCVVVIDSDIYQIGVSEWRPNIIQVLRSRSTEWTSLQPKLLRNRLFASAVAVNGTIYVCGGISERSAESYDPRTGSQSALASMSMVRSDHRLVEVNGDLYAIGGFDGEDFQMIKSVEKYSIAKDDWTFVAPMHQGRSEFGAAVLHGHIYVCGGSIAPGSDTSTAEVYDPLRNVWTNLASMSASKNLVSLVPYMDQLWALDADHPAEVYDPNTDSWAQVSDAWYPNRKSIDTTEVVVYVYN